MNEWYRALGISKQAFHQKVKRIEKELEHSNNLLPIINQIRKDHPTMGARDMYHIIQPEHLGRDKFEAMVRQEGLISERPKNYRKTTDSQGVKRFDNLTLDIKLTNFDQLWQSDITYFEINKRFYYLTFIIDVFSRLIVGYNVSKRLTTEQTTFKALENAIKFRDKSKLPGLILHSDGGGQYYSNEFLKLTQQYEIKNSMCQYPWENANAERINGTIKNNYLKHYQIDSYEVLVKSVDRSVWLYNNEKPHSGLKRKTPIAFEKSLSLDKEIYPTMSSQRRNKKPPALQGSALRAEGNLSSESYIAQE